MNKNIFYNGNPNIKKAGIQQQYTKKELSEYIKCKKDPIYFIENYIKIIDLDNGVVLFKMWDFQRKLINAFIENRFVVSLLPRQMGKSITIGAFLLHCAVFNKHQFIGILANKAATSRKLLRDIQHMYEFLPFFLQPGIVTYNKGSMEFGNGSTFTAASCSSDSVRGFTFSRIALDEFAFVENADEFYESTYPVITSGSSSQVIVNSTPNGMNLFYKIWEDAKMERNDYYPIQVSWDEHPRRDTKWKETTIRNIGKKRFAQEFENIFLGSSGTLISGEKLGELRWMDPIKHNAYINVYELPIKDHLYVATIDVAEGVGGDYSTICVTDVTQQPYRQVAVYRNNQISPVVFPDAIISIVNDYNEAYTLIEINSIGSQVAHIMRHDYEYENILITKRKNNESMISGGFGRNNELGLRMTTKSKRIGCSNIKAMIENDVYHVNDFETISEFQTFTSHNDTYKADEGKHDDLVMPLVSFGWLTSQPYFADLTDIDTRKAIMVKQNQTIMDDRLPIGFHDNNDIEDLNGNSESSFL